MQTTEDKVINYNDPFTEPLGTDLVPIVREGETDVGGYVTLSDLRTYAGTTEVVDNLDSTSDIKALSANQGRVLNGLIDEKASIAQEAFIYATPINKANTLISDPIRYYKNTVGEVMVKGAIENSNGTLPCASLIYKPTVDIYFNVTSENNNTIEKARLTENGDIYITIPDDDTVYINLSFRAE